MIVYAHILVIMTMVGPYTHDWRPIGTFASKANCEAAAVELRIRPDRQHKCLEVKP